MYTAGLVSTSASSTLSETWNVCSVVEPVFRLRNFVWFTGFLCCLRNTHAESTSYGSPSTSTNFLGKTSLYANIRRILFNIIYLSTPLEAIQCALIVCRKEQDAISIAESRIQCNRFELLTGYNFSAISLLLY